MEGGIKDFIDVKAIFKLKMGMLKKTIFHGLYLQKRYDSLLSGSKEVTRICIMTR